MTLFKYTLIDGTEYVQEADYYEVVPFERENLRKEISRGTEYVFWENGVEVLIIPAMFLDPKRGIREVG